MLGPHVVGQRLVVRRLVRGETGPTGGPAFTDLLGTCLSWGEGTCVVQPEDGPPVAIAIADIVSGKPVPPRASTRHRVDPAGAQRRGFALFPDVATSPLGDWVLRHSPTSTARRANSVLAFAPPGVDGAYEQVVDWYAARTGRPIAAVLPDSAEEAFFRARGWVAESDDADTLFQIASVAQARRRLREVVSRRDSVPPQPPTGPHSVPPRPPTGPHSVPPQPPTGPHSVPPRPPTGPHSVPPRAPSYAEEGDLVTVRIGELAGGVAAYAEDWVGFRGIEVDPAHRRQGLGLAVMDALLEWGAERGATTAYLQVLGDNRGAIALYERLGFTTHHAYRYLAPATSA